MTNDGDLLCPPRSPFAETFIGPQLRMAAKQANDAAFTRRLLALAEI
jgi:hypothetical protein